jgi:transposase
MAPHLTKEMRENIVIWHYEGHKKALEIARLARCSERTVYDVLRLHRDFGVVQNPLAQPRGRKRILDAGDVNYLSALLAANPTLYLDELQILLFENRGVDVSLATLSRALRRIALTHKGVAKTAAERNELLRAIWQAEYGDIPPNYFVWIDESSVDDKTNQRGDRWSAMGHACVRRDTFIRGQRFSILPALTTDGIIALDIFEGSVNKERFINWVSEELVCMLLPLSRCVLPVLCTGSQAYPISGTP